MKEAMLKKLWQTLAVKEPDQLYAVIDAAAHTHIHAHIDAWQPPALALQPEDYPLPEETCPWLVHLQTGNTFSDWYLQEGFFAGWGIVLHSTEKLLALVDQLTPWLLARHTEKQQVLLMRFYDPRVVYGYLSMLKPEDRQQWFTGISALWRPNGDENRLEQLLLNESGLRRQAFEINHTTEVGDVAS